MSMMIESQIKFYVESNRVSRDDMLKLVRTAPERSWSIGDKYTCHVGLHKERQYNQCTLSIAGERPVIVLPLFFLEICNGMCKEFKIEVKARKDLIRMPLT